MARGKKKFVTLADHEAEEKAAADSIAVTKVLEDNGNELQSKLTTYPQNAGKSATRFEERDLTHLIQSGQRLRCFLERPGRVS